MKEINLPSGNYLFVEVPDNAYDFDFKTIGITMDRSGSLYITYKPKRNLIAIGKESDTFEIISTTKDITEEQAERIVEFKLETLYPEGFEPLTTGGFRNYEIYSSPYYNIRNAKKSIQSLIQANGLDVNKNYLIIKKL